MATTPTAEPVEEQAQAPTTQKGGVPGVATGLAAVKQFLIKNPVGIVVGLIAIFWVYMPDPIGANYWIFTATAGLILGCAALGLMVVVGWAREVSLMQAALVGTATYWMGYLYRSDIPALGTPGVDPAIAVGPSGITEGKGYPFIVAAIIGILIVIAISAATALATLKLSGIYIMVLTLAIQFTIERTFFADRKLTGGLTPLQTNRPDLPGPDLASDRNFYYFVLSIVFLGVLGLYRLRHSRYGRSLLLVGANRLAAASVGVSPFRYKLLAFCIGGFFAGLAGVLAAPLYGSPPNSLQYFVFNSLFYLAVPVVAGFESMLAVLAVGLLFQLLPQALEPFGIDALVLGGAGLVLGTLAGPRGFGGVAKDLMARFGKKKSTAVVTETEGTPALAG